MHGHWVPASLMQEMRNERSLVIRSDLSSIGRVTTILSLHVMDVCGFCWKVAERGR